MSNCAECGETCTEDEKHACAQTHEFMDALEHNMEAAKVAFGEQHAFHATVSVMNAVFADAITAIAATGNRTQVSKRSTTIH